MPNALKDFYLNEVMRNDVREYLTQFLKDEAVKRLFETTNASIQGFAEAKMVIDKAFENLEVLFAPSPVVKEIKNKSR